MRKTSRYRHHILLALAVLMAFVWGWGSWTTESFGNQQELEKLVKQADQAAYQARFKTRTEENLLEAIKLYENVLQIRSNHIHSLNNLSMGYFAFAEAYLDSQEKIKDFHEEGYRYGLKSLRTNDEFDQAYQKSGSEALVNVPESLTNVEGLFWTIANLGRLSEISGILDSLGKLPKLVALTRRTLELDETYLGGGPHRTMGSIGANVLSLQPVTFFQVRRHGFSWDEVREHFETAIDISPDCLDNYFFYAKYYALERGEKELAESLLEKTLSKPIGDKYPLINTIAKEKARELQEEVFE